MVLKSELKKVVMLAVVKVGMMGLMMVVRKVYKLVVLKAVMLDALGAFSLVVNLAHDMVGVLVGRMDFLKE